MTLWTKFYRIHIQRHVQPIPCNANVILCIGHHRTLIILIETLEGRVRWEVDKRTRFTFPCQCVELMNVEIVADMSYTVWSLLEAITYIGKDNSGTDGNNLGNNCVL